MKKILGPVIAGVMILSAPQLALAKKKDEAASSQLQGIAIADPDTVIANTDAVRLANEQRQVTYKAQIDAAKARKAQIEAQLRPLYEKIQADSQAAKPNQASLQQQAATIQQIEQNGQREISEIIRPVALSEAYVQEQVEDQLDAAVKAAMEANKVTLLLNPSAILASQNSYNLNKAILAELNKAIPNAQLVPPAGWLPRQLREQQAAQQQATAPAASPAAAQPAGPPAETR
ncbi:MAG: OmpH family outer membrane protein [Novosphingobium sp.]|nr:OmpH family outer membrane protein [Novosphingobium sp.]MCP5388731.1 OmpH family outer membrane protein [Novosphingobium sp.]